MLTYHQSTTVNDDPFIHPEYLNFVKISSKKPLHKSRVAIHLIAVTGLRFSEAMGVDLTDIDRDNKLIHITKTYKVYGKSKGYAPTKNPSSLRDVPISQETIKLLDEYIATFRPVQRIIEGLSNTAANKALKRLVGRDVHVHSLRYIVK
ncbi:tyrosine-type recombinase/integrase [Streptococcus orisratti]|uniref:tyrosine-type recombinase/integrase n=1 Tax=Streptococcus orisratti TaxID=114652 RepID=UPI003B5B0EE0